MADTPENQAEYPQVSTMKKGCSFPLMKVVAVFSLLSGAILAAGGGNIHVSEFRLLYDLLRIPRNPGLCAGIPLGFVSEFP